MSRTRARRRSVGSVIPHRGRADEWLITLSLGYDSRGKRRRLVKVVHGTEADADRELAKLLTSKGRMSSEDPGRLSLQNYLRDYWLPSKEGKLRAHTIAEYGNVVGRSIEGRALGRMRLTAVSPLAIDRWLFELRQDGKTKSIRNAYAVLRAGLRQAVRWRMIDFDPTTAVEPPKWPKFHAPKLTPVDARAILAAFAGHALEPPVALALGGGLRRGEALAVRWSDIDFDAAEVHIERQLSVVEGRFDFVPPKTDHSRRVVPIPAWCVAILREHRRRQLEVRLRAGTRWHDNDLVMTTRVGGPRDPREYTRLFQAHLKKDGLPVIRFHDLRHGFASLLLSDGVDIGVISDLMGHSTIAITKDLYAEASHEAKRRAVSRLDNLLGR